MYANRLVTCLLVMVSVPFAMGCTPTTVSATVQSPLITSSSRKKVMVFISKGGNGHMAACNVLKESLPDYDIQVVNPFDIVSSFNIVKKITGGKLDGEQFYVTLVQHNLVRTAGFLAKYPAPLFFHLNRHYFVRKFAAYLEKYKPDLLISTIPYFNYAASTAAQRCHIPFLLITLDADLRLWLGDFEKCRNNDYHIAIGTKTPRITCQLVRSKVASDKIHVVGNPLRKDFFESKDREKILAEWKLPLDKPIAMLIRGGTGSSQLALYVRSLLKLNRPLHLLVCIGKNTKLMSQLKKLPCQGNVSFSIIPFTQRISDLMAVSDLIVTQPSPNVCNEAMQSGVPLLIDMTGPCLFWERATLDWIHTRNAGTSFKKFSQLNGVVAECLEGKRKFAKTPNSPASPKDSKVRS